jgi:hypothetical protein
MDPADPRIVRHARWAKNVALLLTASAFAVTAVAVAIHGLHPATAVAFVIVAMTFYLGVLSR